MVGATKNPSIVPWSIPKRLEDCLYACKDSILLFSHIYREDNTCVDILAIGVIDKSNFCWWDTTSAFVRSKYICNRVSLLAYRFTLFCQLVLVWPPHFRCFVYSSFSFFSSFFFDL